MDNTSELKFVYCKRYAVSKATASLKIYPHDEQAVQCALAESMRVGVVIDIAVFREKLKAAGINSTDIDLYIASLSVDDETYLKTSPQW